MSFNPSDLASLAGTLVSAGAPIIGGIIGGPAGALVGSLVPEIAQALGLDPSATPQAVTAAIAADPNAAAKLQAVEQAHKLAADQAYYQSQIDATEDLAKEVGPSFWKQFLIIGPRPIMLWVSGPITLIYMLAALRFGWTQIPMDFFAATQATFAGLAGVRTVEKWKGIDTKVGSSVITSVAKAIKKG